MNKPPRLDGFRVILVNESLWKEMRYEVERLAEEKILDYGWLTPERFLGAMFNHWAQNPVGRTDLKNIVGFISAGTQGRESWNR